MGEGLLAVTLGDRLVSRGYSSLKDYAREVLDMGERQAQTLVQLARELRTRPLLRAAVRAGEVMARSALTVLPVARGDEEAGWVERARRETVRSLEKAVREARASWGEVGDDLPAGRAFRLERDRRDHRESIEARLEEETDGWSIHGGYMKVRGTAPDGLVREVGGEIFTSGARPSPGGANGEAAATAGRGLSGSAHHQPLRPRWKIRLRFSQIAPCRARNASS